MTTADATPAATPLAKAKRRPYRREQIKAAAVDLFHERGYHNTGMSDIGAGAGITGPGIYRHFKSKEEILETLVLDRSSEVLERVRAMVDDAQGPAELLEQLVELYVDTLVDNAPLTFVCRYERRTLRGEVIAKIERAERLHIEEWVHAMSKVRPELTDGETRVLVHAAIGMAISAATFRSGLPLDVLRPLLQKAMLAVLYVPTDDIEGLASERRDANVTSLEPAQISSTKRAKRPRSVAIR